MVVQRDTQGRRHLVHVLQFTTGREVARRCRVSPSRVSEWASGLCLPNETAQGVLEQVYGIPRASWASTE